MRKHISPFLVMFVPFMAVMGAAQVSSPDDRYKADILVVVAHPDDDTVVSSYLARAIFEEHKRVAVLYCTRGDSGANSWGREHARALGLVREIEGRRAMSSLEITNVWFLNGRDTSSQNVLVSLAAWGSGGVLEDTIRIFRLTRPEVVFTWLPGSVAGENHGDHQAAGVIATQAFDMAGDPAVFAAQLAAPIRQFENALEGLSPWQAKELYYFSDAFDTGFFHGRGPEYWGREISPSRKASYLELAARAAAPYYTQSPDPQLNRQIESGGELGPVLAKLQQTGYFPDPVRLWLAKSLVRKPATADVFEGIGPVPVPFTPPRQSAFGAPKALEVSLAGPWGFYQDFWRAHELETLRVLRPEIAVRPDDTLTIPLLLRNNRAEPSRIAVSLSLPEGWKQGRQLSPFTVPGHGELTAAVPVIAPGAQSANFAEIRIAVTSGGTSLYQESLFVKISPYVAEQLRW
ncbi:MAG: PIG-L family deacetylase [Acidobacteria bacterium]|nr:PIG-L family deacetylase [Acidobacteriota bacterium]